MLYKKLIKNCEDGLFNFSIIARTYLFHLFNNKLKSVTPAYRSILFKGNSIMYATFSLKDVTTFGRQHYIIMSMLINCIKGKVYHSETMVPVKPLRAHSSAMRFSAARFTSNECLKRANASSYVTFFTSILLLIPI